MVVGNRWVGIPPQSQSSQSQQYTSFKKVLFQIEQENLSLSASQCSSFRREHNNILPPKFPATQSALTISDTLPLFDFLRKQIFMPFCN